MFDKKLRKPLYYYCSIIDWVAVLFLGVTHTSTIFCLFENRDLDDPKKIYYFIVLLLVVTSYQALVFFFLLITLVDFSSTKNQTLKYWMRLPIKSCGLLPSNCIFFNH